MLILVTFIPGTSIGDAVVRAIALAKRVKVGVQFNFNGITVFVHSYSDGASIVNQYIRDCKMRADVGVLQGS